MRVDRSLSENQTPYAVLGAGVAGLTAALALLDSGVPGHDITIIEAQEKPGGRVRSKTLSDGTVVEDGAAWFHPTDEGYNPFREFLTGRYGADVFTIVPEHEAPCLALTKTGIQTLPFFDEDIDRRLRDEFNKFHIDHPGADISLLGLARRIKDKDRPRAMIHIRRLAENYMGSAHENDSSATEVFTDPYGDGGPQVWDGLERGIQAMAAELRQKGVTFRFGTLITGLKETPAGVTLTDSSGATHECGQLVCTLPAPILKALLPQSEGAAHEALRHYLSGIQTSHFSKIVVPVAGDYLRARFGQDAAVIHTTSDRFTEASILPAGKPLVILFAIGETALKWESLDKAALLETVAMIFRKIPGLESCREHIAAEEVYVTDWNTNPLFRGSYGAMKVGHTRRGPMPSAGGRIVFAGTEFHPVAGGSMATAHESGLLAARLALEHTPQKKREISPPLAAALDSAELDPAPAYSF